MKNGGKGGQLQLVVDLNVIDSTMNGQMSRRTSTAKPEPIERLTFHCRRLALLVGQFSSMPIEDHRLTKRNMCRRKRETKESHVMFVHGVFFRPRIFEILLVILFQMSMEIGRQSFGVELVSLRPDLFRRIDRQIEEILTMNIIDQRDGHLMEQNLNVFFHRLVHLSAANGHRFDQGFLLAEHNHRLQIVEKH